MSSSIDPEKFMPNLLLLLDKAKKAITDADTVTELKQIEDQIIDMKEKHLLARVKLFDQTLFNQFTTLERCLGIIILGEKTEETKKALLLMDENVKQILNDSSPLLDRMPKQGTSYDQPHLHWSKPDQLDYLARKMSQDWKKMGLEDKIRESPAMANIKRSYEDLESTEMKLCFLSFSVFPDRAKIKKRPLIYWWIGEGFVKKTKVQTAEEVGEEIFQTFMSRGFIHKTYPDASSSEISKDYTMHPWVRRMLITLASESNLFDFDSQRTPFYGFSSTFCRRACLVFDQPIFQGDDGLKVDELLTVLNLNVLYLNLKKEWLKKLNKVAVLQLGRWQNSATHHIELEDEASLTGLGAQNKHLKYLSLRGISRITELPPCIFHLPSLEILDLRACHNLEKLPASISSLRNLTHLDLSECYLLEGLPKGIERLSSLQVLKGFLIGSKKNTACRLGALSKLTKLKRLSIHIGNEAVIEDNEFRGLKDISSLRRLKISWGVVTQKFKTKILKESSDFLFPAELEKLDLQGMPLVDLPTWLTPNQLKSLKKLYIRGGELGSLDHGETGEVWKVEFLRLKHLKKLKTKLLRLNRLFPDVDVKNMVITGCDEIEKDN